MWDQVDRAGSRFEESGESLNYLFVQIPNKWLVCGTWGQHRRDNRVWVSLPGYLQLVGDIFKSRSLPPGPALFGCSPQLISHWQGGPGLCCSRLFPCQAGPWQPTWLSAQMPLGPPFGGHGKLWASFIRTTSRAQKNVSRLCQFIPCRTTKFTQKWRPEYRWDLEPRSLFPYVLPIPFILPASQVKLGKKSLGHTCRTIFLYSLSHSAFSFLKFLWVVCPSSSVL